MNAQVMKIEVWWGGQWIAPKQTRKAKRGAIEALVLDKHANEWGWVKFDAGFWRHAQNAHEHIENAHGDLAKGQ